MSKVEIKLNEGLDTAALSKAYKKSSRLKIKDLLVSDAAEAALKSVFDDTRWLLSHTKDGKIERLKGPAIQALGEDENQKTMIDIYKNAEENHQTFLYTFPLEDEELRAEYPDLYAYKVLEFLNSKPMLDFVRKVTGIKTLKRATAECNWYKRDHFTTLSKDENLEKGQRVSYTLNLTKDWLADWGAFQQFFDDEGHVEEGYMPTFNALELFTAPQNHSVSVTAPFSGHPRLSITGWYYDA
jgi:Rps23 Pro-64 3,4-dihydroxylase Tpa1-like proline 4-hydroxylase